MTIDYIPTLWDNMIELGKAVLEHIKDFLKKTE